MVIELQYWDEVIRNVLEACILDFSVNRQWPISIQSK